MAYFCKKYVFKNYHSRRLACCNAHFHDLACCIWDDLRLPNYLNKKWYPQKES